MNSKFERVVGELHATLLGNHDTTTVTTGGVWVFRTVCCERVVSSPGRGACGRRQGRAKYMHTKYRPIGGRRDPTGVEGAGGSGGHGRASRSTTPSRRLACGDLAGGRARRRPEHQRCHKQQHAAPTASGRPGPEAPGTSAEHTKYRPMRGRRDPSGVEGAGGSGGHGRASKSTTPSRRLACGDLAGGRARRRPEHQRSTPSSPSQQAGKPPLTLRRRAPGGPCS